MSIKNIRPKSPAHSGLTDEFLKSLDDEFDRQKLSFRYAASEQSFDSESLSSGSYFNQFDSFQHSSWYELVKSTKLQKPSIPSAGNVPKIDKLDQMLKSRHKKQKSPLQSHVQNDLKIGIADSAVSSVMSDGEDSKFASKRKKLEAKLGDAMLSGWTINKGIKLRPIASVESSKAHIDEDIFKWNDRLKRKPYRPGKGKNIQFGATWRYKEVDMLLSRNITPGASLLRRSKYTLPTPLSFGIGEKSVDERPRSPGPIYDPEYPRQNGYIPSLDTAGRTLSGSIYEFGFNSRSPGPVYKYDEFKLLSTRLSAPMPKFARAPDLSSVGVVEQKIIDKLNPLSSRRSSPRSPHSSILTGHDHGLTGAVVPSTTEVMIL